MAKAKRPARRPAGGDKLARFLNPPTARELEARGVPPPIPREVKARAAPKGRGRVRADAYRLPAEAERRCYGYCRVSTVAQADEGLSLEVQQRQILGHAQAQVKGLTVTRMFVERGVSGSKPLADRPEGAKLLAILQPGDTVITPKLDRMFRNAENALKVLRELQARSVSLHMIDLGGDVTGNGVSKLVFTILSAVAENERERTRERISEVKADERRKGRFLGGARPPFGWRKAPDKQTGKGYTLEPIPKQQAAIQRMQQLQAEGLALRPIAERIRQELGVTISHAGVGKALAAAERRAQEEADQASKRGPRPR
jgi:putative DNA-invertase from lambdoid prophage Rac